MSSRNEEIKDHKGHLEKDFSGEITQNSKNSIPLFSKLETILSANHRSPANSFNKIDYKLSFSLVSSIWNQSASLETEKLYKKYNIQRPRNPLTQLRTA